MADFESRATIFTDFFSSGEWGGVNSAHLLADGRIAIYGHIARYVLDDKGQKQKEYYAMTAIHDPKANTISSPEIYLTQEDLEQTLHKPLPRKSPVLKSIYFSGGVNRQEDGTMKDYAGVGDTTAICTTCKDPQAEL